jgi:hypothetical protein
MATCVPCDQAFIHHASPISSPLRPLLPSLIRLLNDGHCLHECLGPPFGSCAQCPINTHRVRRFVCGLMHAEVNRTRWRRGAFGAQLLACIFSNLVDLNACGDAMGPSVRGLWPSSPIVAPHRRGSGHQPQ